MPHDPTRFEGFLARLYVDPKARARFLADPVLESKLAGLGDRERAQLEGIDVVGLELAARSFAKKRAVMAEHRSSLRARLGSWIRRFVPNKR